MESDPFSQGLPWLEIGPLAKYTLMGSPSDRFQAEPVSSESR
jgi:hypothetical protein